MRAISFIHCLNRGCITKRLQAAKGFGVFLLTANDSSYKFQFEKTDDTYKLSQGDNKIMVEDKCLVVGKEATELLFA